MINHIMTTTISPEEFQENVGLCMQHYEDHQWTVIRETKDNKPTQLKCTKCGKVKGGEEFCTWLLIQDLHRQIRKMKYQLINNPYKIDEMLERIKQLRNTNV